MILEQAIMIRRLKDQVRVIRRPRQPFGARWVRRGGSLGVIFDDT